VDADQALGPTTATRSAAKNMSAEFPPESLAAGRDYLINFDAGWAQSAACAAGL